MLSDSSIIVVSPDQLSSGLASDVVILDLKRGMYYGLEEVGARIWELIQEPRSFGAIREALLEEFDVDSERCTADLSSLLEEMESKGLVRITDGSSS